MTIDPLHFVLCLLAAQASGLLACLVGAAIFYRASGRTSPVAQFREKATKNPEDAVRYAVTMRKKLQDEARGVIDRLVGARPDLKHTVRPANGSLPTGNGSV